MTAWVFFFPKFVRVACLYEWVPVEMVYLIVTYYLYFDYL